MRKKLPSALLWAAVSLINLYFIYNFPLNYLNLESWQKPFGSLLVTHIVFGMAALVLGPFQFFPTIRKNHPATHRLMGRIYLISILAAGTCAVILAIAHNIIADKRVVFGTGLLGLASAWFLTSGMALWAIKNKNFVQHREWMVRSYVVTCGFTTYRIFAVTLNSFIQLDYDKEMSGIMAWACWSVPLLITEAILQASKIKKAGRGGKAAAISVSAKERLTIISPTDNTTQPSM